MGFDVFGDVLNLPILAMQGNGMECQRIEDRDDVSLRSARDTNLQMRDVKTNELLDKFQDFLTRGGHTSCRWTLVQGIDDNECFDLCLLEWVNDEFLHLGTKGLLSNVGVCYQNREQLLPEARIPVSQLKSEGGED